MTKQFSASFFAFVGRCCYWDILWISHRIGAFSVDSRLNTRFIRSSSSSPLGSVFLIDYAEASKKPSDFVGKMAVIGLLWNHCFEEAHGAWTENTTYISELLLCNYTNDNNIIFICVVVQTHSTVCRWPIATIWCWCICQKRHEIVVARKCRKTEHTNGSEKEEGIVTEGSSKFHKNRFGS